MTNYNFLSIFLYYFLPRMTGVFLLTPVFKLLDSVDMEEVAIYKKTQFDTDWKIQLNKTLLTTLSKLLLFLLYSHEGSTKLYENKLCI